MTGATTTEAAGETAGETADEAGRVARFLRRNPDWLAQQSGLYECLSPPRRVHGEALADHMAAMIDAARDRSRTVLDAGRAGLGLSERVRAAVLALIRGDEPEEWLAADLPRLLGLDAARLCIEHEPSVGSGREAGHRVAAPGDGGGGSGGGADSGCRVASASLPAGTVQRLLGQREVLLRCGQGDADAVLLHGEAAGLALHEALLRVRIGAHPPALLALAARTPFVLDGAGADAALLFLANALSARLERA